MADARSKAVFSRLADLYSRVAYGVDLVTNLRDPIGEGDSIEVPSISALTVNASGGTDANPEAVTTSVLTLTVDRHPWINAKLPAVDSLQLLGGNWASQVAEQATMMLKSSMDEHLMRDFLAYSIAYDASATYHDNVAGDALSGEDILNCKAKLLANDGTMADNLMLWVSPFGEASIMNIAAFREVNADGPAGQLGLKRIGSIYGVPVFSTNSIGRSRAVATTAVSIASNVATATVASGHGIVPGQVISTTGLTTNVTSVAVSSVGATSIVYPCTAADGAFADGIGTITANSCDNLMLDRSHVFTAQQKEPGMRIVPLSTSTGDALQISALWGRQARAGRVRVLHSPASSA